MHTKKNASFIITVALSMIILAFVSYCTVYEQILSKSNGFFNVIIFGVVLILVFIFITLLARIINIKADKSDRSPVVNILISIGILAIFAAFVYSRLQYTSSVSPNESTTYKAAIYMAGSNLAEGKEVHDKLLSNPCDFAYAHFMSIAFNLIDESPFVFTIVNIGMMLIAALFLFLTVNLISGKACAAIAIIFFMFMPNNAFLVYSYNSELFVTALFMIVFYIYEILIYKRFKSDIVPLLLAILCGLVSGLCIGAEPVMLISLVILSVWVIKAKRQKAYVAIIPHIISLIVIIGLVFLKATYIDKSILDVLLGMILCFVPTTIRDSGSVFSIAELFNSVKERFNNPSRFLNENFYFLSNDSGKSFSNNQAIWLDIADQIIYIFMLILCVMCVVYILRVMYDKILPAFSILIGMFVGLILGGVNDVNHVYFTALIILIGSTTIYYMYLNHHNEYAVYITNLEIAKDNDVIRAKGENIEKLDNDKADENIQDLTNLSDEYLTRAKALIFIGENEELYRKIKQEEKIGRINNSIAATMIKTTLNEEGEYDSVEENIEFFDEPDEKPIENKKVHQVVAIPASRPVEVVKPILADDYLETQNDESFDSAYDSSMQSDTFENTEMVHKKAETENDLFAREPITLSVENTEKEETASQNAFVFRKKKDSVSTSNELKNSNQVDKNADVKIKNKKENKLKDNKLKESKSKNTTSKKIKDKETKVDPASVAKGDPLPNPLPVPKPHVSKDLDFDFDVSDNDDFDV